MPSSLHETRGILLLQPPNSVNVGWPRALAFQTSTQMYVCIQSLELICCSLVVVLLGNGQYVNRELLERVQLRAAKMIRAGASPFKAKAESPGAVQSGEQKTEGVLLNQSV